jgi:glycosyltransferase involved in cell wall biosynthesis
MRVLHVITGLAPGGAEHQLRLLLRRLPYHCEVVTLSNPGTVAAAIRADGTTVHELAMRGNRDLSAVTGLVRLMRAGRFDLVHTHLYRACVYGRVAARLARVPHVVATEHSLGDGMIENRPTTLGVRALYLASERFGDVTIAVSGTVERRLRRLGVPRRRIRVIGNGIDPEEFRYDARLRRAGRQRLGIAADAQVVGGVGRLTPTKRFDVLIRAVRELPQAILLLVGDGPARAALEQVADRQGVADRVVFAGGAAHVPEMLSTMDVFASPSEQETFGLAVIEALASGLPTLYAACPPLEEVAADRPAVAGARRLSRTPQALPRALRTELTRLDERGGARLPVPPVVARYDIARGAAAVGRLYERLARGDRRTRSTRYQPVESEGSRR